MKSKLKSKTIWFHMIMLALQSITGSLAMFQSFLDPMQYAIISMVLGVVQSMGGFYLRTVTTEPVE